MLRSIAFFVSLPAALLACASASAAVYRCSPPGGPVRYSDRPCGKGAERMNLDSAPFSEPTGSQPASKPAEKAPGVQVNIHNTVNNTMPGSAAAPAAGPAAPRGLPFSIYRRLETGMSEGQVLALAGPPDQETTDAVNTADGIFEKSFYYYSKGYNAFVTRIRFENGRVVSMERTPILP